MSDHVTISDLASWIRRPDLDPSDVGAQAAIDAAEGEVAAELGIPSLALVADEMIAVSTTGSRIWLPGYPVLELEIEIDADPLELDVDYLLNEATGMIRRLPEGSFWGRGTVLDITYSHGFGTLPGAVRGVVLSAAARHYLNPAGVVAESVLGYNVNRGLDNPGLGLTAGEIESLGGVKR